MVYLTCAVIGLGGRGVIKTWTEVAARVRLYMLTSDLTSLVPPQFSHWLQVRKVGAVYFFVYFYFFRVFYRNLALLPLCSLLLPLTVLLQKNILHLLEKVKFYKLPASNKCPLSRSKKFNQRPGQLIEFGIQLNFFNDNKTF